jgi:hypothetical protein
MSKYFGAFCFGLAFGAAFVLIALASWSAMSQDVAMRIAFAGVILALLANAV